MRPHLHKSSIIVGLSVVVALLFIEIPGLVVDQQTTRTYTFEHGWPMVYLRREIHEPMIYYAAPGLSLTLGDGQLPLPQRPGSHDDWLGIPWLNLRNWKTWEAGELPGVPSDTPRWGFQSAPFIVDVLTASIILAVLVLIWETRRRRRPGLFSFRLTDAFIAITATGIALGWITYLNGEYRAEQLVNPYTTNEPAIWFTTKERCVAPRWLQSLLGTALFPDYFWRTSSIASWGIREDLEKKFVSEVSRLKYLRRITMEPTDRFSLLRNVPQLDTLEIPCPLHEPLVLRDAEFKQLAGLTQLKRLVLTKCVYDRETLVSQLSELLPNCKIVDEGNDW